MKVSTRVPLDQLRPPEEDVREHRPEQAVQSIAQSMGDPTVGQLQPVLAYPAGWEDLDLDSQDDLRQLVQDGHDIIVLDGETRRQAAQDILGWHDLWAWIWDEPPENATVAQLDANTERIDMTEYETIRAIVNHKEDTGRTWTEVAEDVGYHPSTLRGYAAVLNGPDWLQDAMQDPDNVIQVGHAREIYKGIGQDFREAMVELSDLDEDGAKQKAMKLGRNLVGWANEYGWSVTDTRDAVNRKQQDVLDELEIGGGHREHQRQAEKEGAAADHGTALNQEPQPDHCIICGAQATTRIAIDVCDEDRGMLNNQRQTGEPLMAPAEEQQEPVSPDVEALANQLGMDPEEVAQRLAGGGEGPGGQA